MTDIITGWDPATGTGEWVFQPLHPSLWVDENGQVVIDESGIAINAIVDQTNTLEFINDLTTSVLISLFTDAAADDDDVIPDGTTNKRGFWADPTMGSKLWLLSRSKALPSVAQTAQGYAQDALAWLVTDGVASSATAQATWLSASFLRLTVTIVRGSSNISITFANLWDFL